MSHPTILSTSSSRKSLRPGTPKRRTSSRLLGASGKTEEVARAAFRLERAGGGGKTPELQSPGDSSLDGAGDGHSDDADADLVLDQSELDQLKVRGCVGVSPASNVRQRRTVHTCQRVVWTASLWA